MLFQIICPGTESVIIPGGQFNVKSLRQVCFAYTKVNKDSVGDRQSEWKWQQLAAEDAVAGGYASGGRHENTDFERYLSRLKKRAAKRTIFI